MSLTENFLLEGKVALVISAEKMVSTIFSVTVLDLDTSRLHRQLHFVRDSQNKR